MKRFYLAYSDEAIWPQAVAKLPVGTKTDNSEILRQAEPHRGGGVSTAVEIAERAEGKTADSKAAFRGRPRRTPTKGWQVTMRALTKTRSRFTGETYAGDCTD
jgi:hypothetical protein